MLSWRGYIRIATEELATKESGSWTLSATGLYLLRSLEQDCEIGQFSNQLVPCCGHFMVPDEKGGNDVLIMGCPNGIDWKIRHSNGAVIFESEKGAEGRLLFTEYKSLVFNFISEIEDFYGDPTDKIIPDEEFDRSGFYQFCAEWNELKNKWK